VVVNSIVIDGNPLTRADVISVARDKVTVVTSPSLADRMKPARDVVESAVDSSEVVYGITTGFGAMASTHIGRHQTEALQYNLIRSHAAGVGDPLPDVVVRAMLLLRARTLAQGHSGVRPEIVERLVEMLNRGILPLVPSQGSVGASGDLAPFAHLALPLIGEGEVRWDGETLTGAQALSKAALEPLRLHTKEGLSLLNGTEGMTAMGILGHDQANTLLLAADVACALTVEAVTGSSRPFRPEVHALRPHPGQGRSARRIAALLEGSGIGASHADDFHHAVQDAYSLRCAPQVHGAVADTLNHMAGVLEIEIGSVVDNPIVFPDTAEVISAGNFHGQPLAFVLDFCAIAVTELGSISERRTDRMLDPTRSAGLPAFLSPDPGVNSGYMISQYTQAALVAENRVLSHPASVESIPTSGMQEDHVSMGWGAGRKLFPVLDNTRRVLAVEMLCATQALEYRRPLRPAPGTAAVAALIREHVPPLTEDRSLAGEIETVAELIRSGEIEAVVSGHIG
jgi:histidine ammonia-lyase